MFFFFTIVSLLASREFSIWKSKLRRQLELVTYWNKNTNGSTIGRHCKTPKGQKRMNFSILKCYHDLCKAGGHKWVDWRTAIFKCKKMKFT